MESNSPCLMCLCLFGNIVCHQPQCPIPEPECRLAHVQEQTCCPSYICGGIATRNPNAFHVETPIYFPEDLSSPEALNQMESSQIRKTEGLVTPIPDFVNNAIHTNSPPTLHVSHETTTPQIDTNGTEDGYGSYFEELFNVFSDSYGTSSRPPTTEKLQVECNCTEAATKAELNEAKTPQNDNAIRPNGMGLLKLAGCNIYGRMYRVGRIISELSGPCLECMCTEIGVQCRALGCL